MVFPVCGHRAYACLSSTRKRQLTLLSLPLPASNDCVTLAKGCHLLGPSSLGESGWSPDKGPQREGAPGHSVLIRCLRGGLCGKVPSLVHRPHVAGLEGSGEHSSTHREAEGRPPPTWFPSEMLWSGNKSEGHLHDTTMELKSV